jgi:hypothetical protein
LRRRRGGTAEQHVGPRPVSTSQRAEEQLLFQRGVPAVMHTAIYASLRYVYCYICERILLASSYCCICALKLCILLYMCPHTTSIFILLCVLKPCVLLYMCPHTTSVLASSYMLYMRPHTTSVLILLYVFLSRVCCYIYVLILLAS